MPNISEEINVESQQEMKKALVFTGQKMVSAGSLAMRLLKHLNKKGKNNPGKTSLRKLAGDGQGLSNIEISDKNIGAFEPFAKKYGIKYSLQRVTNSDPPKHIVTFRSNNADAMTAAFREFTEETLQRKKKPSILEKMDAKKRELSALAPDRDAIRNKTHGEMEL